MHVVFFTGAAVAFAALMLGPGARLPTTLWQSEVPPQPAALGAWTSPASVPRVGLINDKASDDFFSTDIDFEEAFWLLDGPEAIWEAADKDFKALNYTSRQEYLDAIDNNVAAFTRATSFVTARRS